MGGRKSTVPVASLIVIVAGAFAPGAHGAVTIGETFPPAQCVGGAFLNLTLIQAESPAGQYVVPGPGVIVGWSYQAGTSPPSGLRLKVVRPAGGSNYTVVGESAVKTPVANSLNTYTDVSIPVEAGDVIGFYFTSGGQCARTASAGYVAEGTSGDPSPGTTSTFSSGLLPGTQLDVAATFEPQAARTLTLDASKHKVKKGKRVSLSGVLDAPSSAACEGDQAVELQRLKAGVPSTIAQARTDSAGAFAFSLKPKKTFSYRVQVSESDACAGQVSSQEKVKVKKKG